MATILVVDDHSVSRECTAVLLRAQGYEVLRAANAADALALLDQCDADLALIDVLMPGMNGLQLLKELKRQKREMPVVLVTGVVDPELSATGIALGAERVLVKARFSPDQLLEIVARYLPDNVAVA
ncbi:MAG TPA: response regulator [Tepidisphaeraceae bacterium]|jgi:CheY-like chemotaxis protein|nr:response regulator [Tepidisphaeraceae bacterium]